METENAFQAALDFIVNFRERNMKYESGGIGAYELSDLLAALGDLREDLMTPEQYRKWAKCNYIAMMMSAQRLEEIAGSAGAVSGADNSVITDRHGKTWIRWHGISSKPPVRDGVSINVLYLSGFTETTSSASHLDWGHMDPENEADIIGYKLAE